MLLVLWMGSIEQRIFRSRLIRLGPDRVYHSCQTEECERNEDKGDRGGSEELKRSYGNHREELAAEQNQRSTKRRILQQEREKKRARRRRCWCQHMSRLGLCLVRPNSSQTHPLPLLEVRVLLHNACSSFLAPLCPGRLERMGIIRVHHWK